MRRTATGALAAVLVLVLSACGAATLTPDQPHVDVDTPALRALKHTAGIAPCPRPAAAPVRHGLPDVTLPCLGGGHDVAMARLRGPLVVNLWAQWCAPCRKELPHYQAFARAYAGRVGVLGVDWADYRPELALQLARRAGVTYPLVADLGPRIRAVGNALPQLVLVDAAGEIAFQQGIEIKSVAQLERLVREHLGVGRG